MSIRPRLAAATLLLAAFGNATLSAQSPAAPAFSLASSQIFTTRDSPSIDLVFQQVDHLDFRVYRVKDSLAFFAGLKDPHQLGSPEPVVPQDQTWLERIAAWKAGRRSAIRGFLRGQVSSEYRVERRKRSDRAEVQRRQTVGYQTFAQVPLLNQEQLVASWREILPPVRDAEARRLPLQLPGPGVYVVEAVAPPHRAYTIVMVSDVGLVTKTAPGQTLLYAAHRFTGQPVADCGMSLLADQATIFSGASGVDGVAAGPIGVQKPDHLIAVARCGDQTAATDAAAYLLRGSGRELLGYIYTDKPIYRPGHTVNVKAVLRWRDRDRVAPFDRPKVEVAIVDPDDKVLQRQELDVDAFGAVKTAFPIPGAAALGYYAIRLTSADATATGTFEVQEYRKPEFEVLLLPASRYIVQGGKAQVTVRARYYFGQPVARGSLTYVLYKSNYYSPLRWSEESGEEQPADAYYAGDQMGETTVRLDEHGEAQLAIDVPVDEVQDYTLRIDGRVTDASGREVSGRGAVVGTRGEFLVATSLDRYVYRAGDSAELRIRTVDYLGAPRAGVSVAVALERLTWPDGYGGQRQVTPVSQSSVQTDAAGRASWRATIPGDSGSYRLRATATSAGRGIEDESSLWIPGAEETSYGESERYLEMVADRPSYAPGDTARLLLRGADFDATVLVTKEAQTIAWHKVMAVPQGQAIDVPIDEHDVGDTWVNVVFLKDDRAYRAEKRLRVPATSRSVQVSISVEQAVARPRDPGVFTIRTVDAAGAPVRAQVSLAAIDEAVFAVKPDQTPDPLRFFYRREYSRVGTQFSRDYSFVGYSGAQPLRMALAGRRPFTLADFKAERESRPHVRKEFPDAIYWMADLVTDATGTATVKVAYPDALTTWRLTARAVTADTRVGATIARTTTTKDLILRLITPRFLTEGDAVRLPTVVHNYLPEAKTIDVSIAAKGLDPAAPLAPVGATVAARGESRHEWPFAARAVGTATITATATTPGDGDAVELPIPVLPYGALATTGDAGSVTGPGEQLLELTIPEQSNPAARSIELALAPSLAGSLFGALDFLAEYPYGCTEQTISSFFPNLAVIRTLDALQLAPAERLRLVHRMAADGVKRLLDLQHDDGGWGWWKTDENHPFMTAYALWALVETLEAKQPVDRWRAGQAATATARLFTAHPKAVPELKAWMAYALARAAAADIQPEPGDGPAFDMKQTLDALWNARGSMSGYGKALLLLTLDATRDTRAATLAPELAAMAQTNGTLSWWTSDDDPLLGDWMDTSVEATATALRALAPHRATDPLLERSVRWLMANRHNGSYWTSTKQTALALVGILEYLRIRREAPATFTVDVEVNGKPAASHTFTPAAWTDANPQLVRVAGQTGANQIKLTTRGPGTVYYTATARYYDNREVLEQTGSRKLALARKYFTLTPVQKNGRTVYRDMPFTGTLGPGDLVLVRLTAAGSTDWRYLMLDDPLPAGMEAVREDDLYELERPPEWWHGSKREYRDARVVQFQSDFTRGRYEYAYLLKAVTPGRFRAMPARLAPMYAPDVAATTGPQTVEITSPAAVAAPGSSR